eukprot:gene15950-18964_t
MAKSEKQPLLTEDQERGDIMIEHQESKFEKFRNMILKKEMVTVLIYTLLYIGFGVVNSVLLKIVMNSFQNYSFFLNQLTNYGYLPIFGVAVAYKTFFTNHIPKETSDFPKYKFLIMGALDAVTGYFVVVGGVSTPGPLQQLLNQAIIPVTMIASFVILRERYSWIQVSGALVILGGVGIALVPALTGKGESGGSVFWYFFYLLNVLPFALSNVYKYIGFQSVDDMDVWYFQFWDCVFQSMVGTFLFPINAILPAPGTIPFSSVPTSLKDGAMCLAGHNTIVNNCGDINIYGITCDACHNAWIIILCYMTVNVIYNIFILLVLKHAGPTIYSIASTVRLPLTNIVFSLHFIMGSATQPFSSFSVAGLVVILLGLASYRVGSIIKDKKTEAEGGVQVRVIPGLGPAGVDVMPSVRKPFIEPKSPEYLRNQFFGKLGIQVPENRYNILLNKQKEQEQQLHEQQ